MSDIVNTGIDFIPGPEIVIGDLSGANPSTEDYFFGQLPVNIEGNPILVKLWTLDQAKAFKENYPKAKVYTAKLEVIELFV